MPVRKLSEVAGLSLDPRGTGKMLVKIIDAGEGSSADYPADVLKQAEADGVFAAGLHMYLDHADDSRRGVHGERSVRDLASVLTSNATYDDTENALVAEAQAVAGYESTLEALAPHVGLSISALVEVDPPARPGGKPVARRFLVAESVDWVVHAGRGGAVMAILESAAPIVEAATQDRRDQLDRIIGATYADRSRDVWAYVHDFDDINRIVWFAVSGTSYAQSYEIADDDQSVTLTGERTEVRPVTQYVPVVSTAGVTETESLKEELMPEITQAELDALNTRLSEAQKRAEEAEAKIADAEKARLTAESRAAVAAKVTTATEGLPVSMVARIHAAVETHVGETVPDNIDATITAAIEAEKAYAATLANTTGLVGFGQTVAESAPTQPIRTRNAFGREIKES